MLYDTTFYHTKFPPYIFKHIVISASKYNHEFGDSVLMYHLFSELIPKKCMAIIKENSDSDLPVPCPWVPVPVQPPWSVVDWLFYCVHVSQSPVTHSHGEVCAVLA